LTYTIAGTAVPKVQYNPNAVLLKNLTLTNQTADIIFGGVNDTEGVDDLDGDVYDYFVCSSGLAGGVVYGYINEVETANKSRQLMYNAGNGTIGSVNQSSIVTYDFELYNNSEVKVHSDTGRNKISLESDNIQSSVPQREQYYINPDTSTKMTSLMLRPSASVSGNVQLYAVRRGDNADLTPWGFSQPVIIAGDFSAGHSFEIPDWALFMKIDFVGDNNGFVSLIANFNNTTQTHSNQYLRSLGSATSANSATGQSDMRVSRIDDESKSEFIMSLKSGANRPSLLKLAQDADELRFYGQWLEDSSTVLTSVQIKASNTDLLSGILTVQFY